MTLEITVHHFTKSTEKLSVGSARALVNAAAINSTVWRVATHAPNEGTFRCKGNLFSWTLVPPKVQRKSDAAWSLPEWDFSSPLTEIPSYPAPVYEFESTDFARILKSTSCIKPVLNIRRCFAAELDTNSEAGLHKRARLLQTTDDTFFSIFKTIPLPHYLDVPFPTRSPPNGIDQIPEFPILCCLVPTVRIRSRYVRTAWIIPLRGTDPAQGVFDAQLSITQHGPNMILWNSCVLLEFWTFLSQQRLSYRLGPLSFGYICAPMGRKQLERPRIMGRRTPCSSEYIKIYHDVKYAMKIRNVIDSFRCSNQSIPVDSVTRIYKGKKLLLVDEECKPILLA